MSIGSVLDVLVLKNDAECTSRYVKRTSGARVLISFLSIARSRSTSTRSTSTRSTSTRSTSTRSTSTRSTSIRSTSTRSRSASSTLTRSKSTRSTSRSTSTRSTTRSTTSAHSHHKGNHKRGGAAEGKTDERLVRQVGLLCKPFPFYTVRFLKGPFSSTRQMARPHIVKLGSP